MVSRAAFFLLAITAFVAFSRTSYAEDPRSSLSLGILSPLPAVVGAHLALSTSEHTRIRGGMGVNSPERSSLTFGLGADYLFTPQESFTPIFGFELSTRDLYHNDRFQSPIGQQHYFTLATAVEIYAFERTALDLGLNWLIASPEIRPVLNPNLSFGFLF